MIYFQVIWTIWNCKSRCPSSSFDSYDAATWTPKTAPRTTKFCSSTSTSPTFCPSGTTWAARATTNATCCCSTSSSSSRCTSTSSTWRRPTTTPSTTPTSRPTSYESTWRWWKWRWRRRGSCSSSGWRKTQENSGLVSFVVQIFSFFSVLGWDVMGCDGMR